MTVIDAADGVGMAWAYAYGQGRHNKRRFYNLILTGVSAFLALGLGLLEVLQVLAERMHWREGLFWESVNNVDTGILVNKNHSVCLADLYLPIGILNSLSVRSASILCGNLRNMLSVPQQCSSAPSSNGFG